MRFLPKTTCEKLVKMGCVSKSGFYYIKVTDEWEERAYYDPSGKDRSEVEYCLSVFTLEDFLSTDEYAKENCRKIWPDKSNDGQILIKYKMNTPKGEWVSHSEFFRQEIIKSKDWVEFISKAVEERSKTL